MLATSNAGCKLACYRRASICHVPPMLQSNGLRTCSLYSKNVNSPIGNSAPNTFVSQQNQQASRSGFTRRTRQTVVASASAASSAGVDKAVADALIDLRGKTLQVKQQSWPYAEVEIPLEHVLRHPDSYWAQSAVEQVRCLAGIELTHTENEVADAVKAAMADVGEICLEEHSTDSTSLAIAAHIAHHHTLCGAPLPAEATLSWLRDKVLTGYGLPDPTDLQIDMGRAPVDGIAPLLRIHYEAAAELAAKEIKQALPSQLLFYEEKAFFVLVLGDGGSRFNAVRLSEPPESGSRRLVTACGSEILVPDSEIASELRQQVAESLRAILPGFKVEWRKFETKTGGPSAAPVPLHVLVVSLGTDVRRAAAAQKPEER
ncbi:hypothetical protein Agub_g2399 [Astrephomene gubernaculifera]|uniref:Uncharacterized protein n=1 Tax=Astrephomene gubernaculifera TaxID=47775 RepID=A0AAD3DJ22_9CHLO|nr:hypothetical protein Agub_g2399 [Astrephomene gubernaculifera]